MPRRAFELVLDPENETWVSAASIWETAIKHKRRRALDVDAVVSGSRLLELLLASNIGLLPVKPEHAAEVDLLPLLHGDPFDRLLIAQARLEPMRLLTVDLELPAYGDTVLLVS